MMGATLAAVDVFLAYISVVIFFLSVSLLLFCYWRYSGRVRRALMPRDGRRDGRTDGRTNQIRFPIGANAISSSGALKCRKCKVNRVRIQPKSKVLSLRMIKIQVLIELNLSSL